MIAVDTNLLVYAHREDSDFHAQALHALCGLAGSGQRWTIPLPCLHEFIAITTHPRIYDPPTPLAIAFRSLEAWAETAHFQWIGEGVGYLEELKKIAMSGKVAGPMIHDARIAAICLNNGVRVLWTADRDFSRFPGLKTQNPLAGGFEN